MKFTFDGTNYNDISVPVKGNLRFELPNYRSNRNRLHVAPQRSPRYTPGCLTSIKATNGDFVLSVVD